MLLLRLLKMRSLSDDNETIRMDVKKGAASAQPSWMRALKESCVEWLQILPKVRGLAFVR